MKFERLSIQNLDLSGKIGGGGGEGGGSGGGGEC